MNNVDKLMDAIALLNEKDTEIAALKAKYRDLENDYVATESIYEAICDMVTTGKEPSDFMMSFPSVREMWDAINSKDAEIAKLKERVRLAEEKADELGMEAAHQLERVRELEAERNLLKSDLDKVERGYDEVSQRRDETVAMCDYLQNQVKDLENILEQESRMVKAFMSELDKNQDENEFLHGRISELEAKNKRLQSELNKWTRPYDNADLQVMKEQSDSKSLAAQQAYINALDWHYRHEQAENNWLKEALEKYQAFWEDSRMADKMSWEQYDWPIRKKALEGK